MSETTLSALYRQLTGQPPATVLPIAPAASGRRYYRLSGPVTVVGCVGPDIAENKAFIYLTRHFSEMGFPVSAVRAVADDCSCYLLDDLGDTSLYDALAPCRADGRYTPEAIDLLQQTVRALARLQFQGSRGLDYSRCYPRPGMDAISVGWDLNYFKYCFLKPSGIDFDEAALECDFAAFADELLAVAPTAFMYRDFQSRNVMVVDGVRPAFIDYQGGRLGPVHYDLASFLWQPRAAFPDELRRSLVDTYIDAALCVEPDFDAARFRRDLPIFIFFRTLQVLGAYGFRGLVERKSRFVEAIPAALTQLMEVVDSGVARRWPELERVCRALAALPRFKPSTPTGRLCVTITSFSYRRGFPDDLTGNGGGYVFDCRALPNPGRIDCYKPLTGRDVPVADYLRARPEVDAFLNHAWALVDASVERYISRGFTDLYVAFGCTGGRHRSVYSAEQTAKHLIGSYDVDVRLVHREHGISTLLSPSSRQ